MDVELPEKYSGNVLPTRAIYPSRLVGDTKWFYCTLLLLSKMCCHWSLAIDRVARWLSSKYRTLAVPVSVAENIELLAHCPLLLALLYRTEPKYRTVRLNTEHQATAHREIVRPKVGHLHVIS